jgi:hypothetical protein
VKILHLVVDRLSRDGRVADFGQNLLARLLRDRRVALVLRFLECGRPRGKLRVVIGVAPVVDD